MGDLFREEEKKHEETEIEKPAPFSTFREFDRDRVEPQKRPSSPAGSGANGAAFLRSQNLQRRQDAFEETVKNQIKSMENTLGKVAGVQQAQLQRLIDLWGKGAGKFPEPPIAPRHTVPRRTPTGGLNPAAAGGATDSRSPQGAWGGIPTRPRRVDTVEDDDLSLMSGYEGDEEWREYHGTAMWKREAEKKKRNPFDHQAYIRKGEKVESFEELMVITFKTMSQLLDLKYDLRGLIKHGQTLAEKAAKRVFKPTALVQYDESVRERAGEVGPTAFGPVSQEDELFTHHSWQ